MREELESIAWYSPAWYFGINKMFHQTYKILQNIIYFHKVSQTKYHPKFVLKDTSESVSTRTGLSPSQKSFSRRLMKLLLFQDAGRSESPSPVHRRSCCCWPCCIWFTGSAHTVLWFGSSHCHFTGISCHLCSVKVSHRSTPACKCLGLPGGEHGGIGEVSTDGGRGSDPHSSFWLEFRSSETNSRLFVKEMWFWLKTALLLMLRQNDEMLTPT